VSLKKCGEIMSKKMYQEWFDKALNGIRAQGCASVRGGRCCFDDGKGNRCAIGHLFPDDYSLADVGGSVPPLYGIHAQSVWKSHLALIGVEEVDLLFVNNLRECHDTIAVPFVTNCRVFMNRFEERMGNLAAKYDLVYRGDNE
jgi:hypothetical protein